MENFKEGEWLEKLRNAEAALPFLLRDPTVKWNTLLVNYDPPMVERLWCQVGENRLYLHRISPCEKALFHAHPWPSAIKVLSGGYDMGVGFGAGDEPPPIATTLFLAPGSEYEMIHPDGWHYVRPKMLVSYSIMLTGRPWSRKSPGKDVDHKPLSDENRDELLQKFMLMYS